MKKLIGGGLVALAIGLTGCTVVAEGEPTAVAPQASDFAIDVTIVSAQCGDYHRGIPLGSCLYSYDVSARWLPAVPLPSGMTTVTYAVNGGSLIPYGDFWFSGTRMGGYPAQTYVFPVRRLVIGPEGANLTGTATQVVMEP